MRPRIGITVHTYEDVGPEGQRETRFQLTGQYARAIVRAGGTPLLIPTRAEDSGQPRDVLGALDGILFSGGGRVPARVFEGDATPSLRETNPERYDFEVDLARAAREQAMPILGICRGVQTLAEAEGGRLETNLERLPEHRGRHYQTLPPQTATHGARLESDSVLGRALPRMVRVNSFHRQAIDVLPVGYRAVAYSDDGLIEAIESDDGRVLGTQFHPEWLAEIDAGFGAPFAWLVARAAGG